MSSSNLPNLKTYVTHQLVKIVIARISKCIHMDEDVYLYHIYMLHTYCYMQLNIMCNLFYTTKQSLVTCVACT